MRNSVLFMMVALLMAGCGRKEPPQAIIESDKPVIASLKVVNAAPSNKLEIRLAGGAGGVGYQIDRAEMDPYCKCPSMFQRYYEEPPMVQNYNRLLKKMIRLEVGGHDYVYRVRAIDAAGRLGAWQRIEVSAK